MLSYCCADTRNAAFVIASGAILGIGAAFLWIAQGDIMIAYPSEGQKGRAIGLFWVVFNLGGAVGGFMSFGLNFHSASGTVSNGTCRFLSHSLFRNPIDKQNIDVAFIAVMALGWLLGVLIVPPTKVIRPDGTRCQVQQPAKTNFWLLLRHLYYAFTWKIILLLPMLHVYIVIQLYLSIDLSYPAFVPTSLIRTNRIM
jgi:Ion channel regulatory protein UNC-93